MANTKNPSGLTAARNGMKITYTWKIADEDYNGGQQIQWKTNLMPKWTTVTVDVKATSYTVTLNAADYYPVKAGKFLKYVALQVRGKRGNTSKATYEWSAWTKKDYVPTTPANPSVSAKLDDTLNNQSTYSWSVAANDTDRGIFKDCEWQSILVKESNQTDGSKLSWKASALGWRTGTTGKTGSVTIPEEAELLARNSYTRWVRVRARGCAYRKGGNGVSNWRYAKHVYAMPYLPVINSAKNEGNLTWIRVNWTANQSASHPIDFTEIQWTIDQPEAGRACPAGASWETARTLRDTSGKDEVSFLADSRPSLDECLWVRVGVTHDRNSWRATGAELVMMGDLTDPDGLSVETDDSTYRATITANNNSEVPDSRLAVVMRATKIKDVVVGIIPHGQTTITVQCPNWSGNAAVSFGVYAFQGSATGKTANGITTYAVTANMKSKNTVWQGGSVPVAPSGVTAEMTDTAGEVLLTWNWAWTKANRAEISWSQNPNAWESTDEPETYTITNLHTAKWRVSGLETGVTWFFCIRLANETSDGTTYGPYCDPIAVDLSSAPSIPVLSVTRPVITQGDALTASWAYSTTDGTQQAYAEICEAAVSGDTVTYGSVIAHATTQQHVAIDTSGWTVGSTHYLCVRVKSASGRVSDGWSDPVSVLVAEPVTCDITQTSLQEITIGEEGNTRTVLALTVMPLTVTIEGAGAGGTTSMIIERADEYHMIRPDESVRNGFDGETIVLIRQTGENQITIDNNDLIGLLDDGAPYRMIATVEDGIGQTDTQEIEFEVHWTHQAGIPRANVTVVDEVAVITAIAPDGAVEGDVCDIYRLTADLPELIVQGGEFGTAYVDPYPAIGTAYGHRVVHRTINGDYITADNQPAWTDLGADDGDVLELDHGIINFNGESLPFLYNAQLSSSWNKDFEQTRYLGGSIVGDWNIGVARTATINAKLPSDDAETVRTLRRLAEYCGICHVRTQDGSSYSADVQVGDSISFETAGKIFEFTLTITRIDPETLDGMPYSEWINELE